MSFSHMIAPRRYLPSISALLAFEALARLGSATAAAQELSLTQGAVSRQVKALEDQIGVALVERSGRELMLNPVGREYAVQIRSILHQLAGATVKAASNPDGGTLNLAILPAFGLHWLAPRLGDFARNHPAVTVNLATRMRPFDFRSEPFDAAIHFGREDWPEVGFLPLMAEEMVPVAAPSRLPEPVTNAAALLSQPLLHLETRPYAWRRWFEGQGITEHAPSGMMFDQFATMAEAAAHGLGVALLPTFLAEPEIERGRLVVAHHATHRSVGSYYLVWPLDRADHGPLRVFRSWLDAIRMPQA